MINKCVVDASRVAVGFRLGIKPSSHHDQLHSNPPGAAARQCLATTQTGRSNAEVSTLPPCLAPRAQHLSGRRLVTHAFQTRMSRPSLPTLPHSCSKRSVPEARHSSRECTASLVLHANPAFIDIRVLSKLTSGLGPCVVLFQWRIDQTPAHPLYLSIRG